MITKDALKFIIIGSGNIAKTYHSAIQNIKSVEVVGLVSRNKSSPKG